MNNTLMQKDSCYQWLICIWLFSLSYGNLSAQVILPQITDKNNQIIGSSFGSELLRARQEDDRWLWWWQPAILPKWGYFVKDRLVLGIRGEYFLGNMGTLTQTPPAYGLGYWGRYYLPVKRFRKQKYQGEDGRYYKVKVRKDSVKAAAIRCFFEFTHTYISSYSILGVYDVDSVSVRSYEDLQYMAAGFGANIRLKRNLYFEVSIWGLYFLDLPDKSLRFSPDVGRIGIAYFMKPKKRKG